MKPTFANDGNILFSVPNDLSVTEVAGKDDYWIRARLVGGDYGRPIYRVVTKDDTDNDNQSTQEVTVDIDNINQPEIISISAVLN